MPSQPVRLKQLLQDRHWQTYRMFCTEYNKAARSVDKELVDSYPSRAQLHRWLHGDVKGLPYAHHCRVLEAMFPGIRVAQMFEPVTQGSERIPRIPHLPHRNGAAHIGIVADEQNLAGQLVCQSLDCEIDVDPAGLSQVSYDLNLSGDWWCAWQTSKNYIPRIDTHMLVVHQQGELLQLDADRALAEGSYRWRGELRLWDNEALMGWYRSTEGAVRSKGTMYLALHPHGEHAWGRWVGMSYDGVVISGWGAVARTENLAHKVVHDLVDADGR